MSTFVDQVQILVKAGHGGNGACSFRREKFVPRGGPDGGDGGNGGSVLVQATTRLSTLLDLRYQKHYEAEKGETGGGSNCHGRRGNRRHAFPSPSAPWCSTTTPRNSWPTSPWMVKAMSLPKAAWEAAATRNSPHRPTACRLNLNQALPGEERLLRLDLKLLADVGLVGYPNAGKSTFIAAVSAARPKIADYPFTTLTPNLGVVRWTGEQTFVIADIPGLIEGAHEGKGLGFQFLRHIERTSLLIHVIDISEWATEDPVVSFEVMRHEFRRTMTRWPHGPLPWWARNSTSKVKGNGSNSSGNIVSDERFPFSQFRQPREKDWTSVYATWASKWIFSGKPRARRTPNTSQTRCHQDRKQSDRFTRNRTEHRAHRATCRRNCRGARTGTRGAGCLVRGSRLRHQKTWTARISQEPPAQTGRCRGRPESADVGLREGLRAA